MLTDSERHWLEERGAANWLMECYSCLYCEWREKGEVTCLFRKCQRFNENYRDCAEFEARVAAKILDVTIGDLPCAEGPDCQAPHFHKYNTKERTVGCNMCTLCVARLAVEAEMETEGK